MLKNLKKKIRKWLINQLILLLSKLGYDYYAALADTPVRVEKVEIPVINVFAETTVEDLIFYDAHKEDIKQEVYRRLSRQIGEEAIKYAKFSRTDNLINGRKIYRAEIRIENNNDNFFDFMF